MKNVKYKLIKSYISLGERVKNISPFLHIFLFIKPVNYYNWYKSNEYKVSQGKLVNRSQRQSVIFFSTWKCASMLVQNIIDSLLVETDLQKLDYIYYFERTSTRMYRHFDDHKFLTRVFRD